MLKGRGGGTNNFDVVLTWRLEFLAVMKELAKGFHPLKKGWSAKRFTLSGGRGGRKHFWTHDFPIL